MHARSGAPIGCSGRRRPWRCSSSSSPRIASGVITSYDSIWSIPVARSLLREGNTDLDEYRRSARRQPLLRDRTDRRARTTRSFPSGLARGPPRGVCARRGRRGARRREDRAGDLLHRRRAHRRAALSARAPIARRAGLASRGADLRLLHGGVVDGHAGTLAAWPVDADADARPLDRGRRARPTPAGPVRRASLWRSPTSSGRRTPSPS